LLRSEMGCMWVRCSATDLSTVSTAVVGTELMRHSKGADHWIAEVVDCARQTRNRVLCSALLGAPLPNTYPPSMTELPQHLFEVGSGAVNISCDELGLYAMFDAEVWRGAPQFHRESRQSLPHLVPIERAIHQAVAHLEVVLGDAEVELPKLMDLRCGDVLRLSQRLDRSIAVLCEGQLLAHAALGQAEGRVSVQIMTSQQ
jgi:flagellar motor switch/type III secretory pathway protein FliN